MVPRTFVIRHTPNVGGSSNGLDGGWAGNKLIKH